MNQGDRRNKRTGFTLIELLIVVAIIGILSALVLLNLSLARRKARDTSRTVNLRNLQATLEGYNSAHGSYPKTFDSGDAMDSYGECLGDGTDYIPDLVPETIPSLPSDIALNCSGSTHSWVYASDGTDFKLITHPEDIYNFKPQDLVDPVWDDGPDPCVLDGPDTVHIGVWTEAAKCWAL